MTAIEVTDLWKVYEIKQHRKGLLGGLHDLVLPRRTEKAAVRGISFQIGQGESVGYIGPNGSGKSTTIKMLTGILTPTRGHVLVRGIEPSRHRLANAAHIGAVFGQRTQLWWDLAIRESFDLFRHIYRIPAARFKHNIERMYELLQLQSFDSTPVRQLSLGQRMRAEIACAFFHDPAIVYLDEPTIGLDLVAKEQIRGFLRDINRELRTTIILTTHDMEDIEQVCNRLIMIDEGQIIFDGGMQQFVNTYGTERILTVELEHPVSDFVVDRAQVVVQEGHTVKMLFNKSDITATQLISQLTTRYPVTDCQLQEPKIEHLIRGVYESRGAGA
jgi:ABC-2 type transport system ATP-binding protein